MQLLFTKLTQLFTFKYFGIKTVTLGPAMIYSTNVFLSDVNKIRLKGAN